MSYRKVFARFAFTREIETELERRAAELLEERCGRTSERLPRVEVLRSAPDIREGIGHAMREASERYRCYEHMMFCELVPGYAERHAAWEAQDESVRAPDVLEPHELRTAERILFCALALASALYKELYPFAEDTRIPLDEFVATVRRAFASQGFAISTPDTPCA